jgi:hypothetical protein
MTAGQRKMTMRGAAIGALIGVLAFLYFSGRLDPTLYHVGLNYTECGQNGFGAVYCGDDLTEYNRRVESAVPTTGRSGQPTEIEENEAAYWEEKEAREQEQEEAKDYGRELKEEECEAIRQAEIHNKKLEASLCENAR